MLPFCCFLKTSGPKCLQYPAQQKVIPGMVLYKVCGVQLWYIRQSRSGLHNNIGRLFGETLLWRHMIGATRCCKRAYFWVIAFSSWETFSLSLDMLQVRKILCPDHARIHGEEMVPWLIHHLLALRSEKKVCSFFPLNYLNVDWPSSSNSNGRLFEYVKCAKSWLVLETHRFLCILLEPMLVFSLVSWPCCTSFFQSLWATGSCSLLAD